MVSQRLSLNLLVCLLASAVAILVFKTLPIGKSAPKSNATQKASIPKVPPPTLADVAYGPHPRQVLHFWKAPSSQPTPLVLYLHGGAWTSGDRMSGLPALLSPLLKAGISVVSVEYRLLSDAAADHLAPPIAAPSADAARALQFVRSKAADWNLDRKRIAASGVSAGACTALWLAFHADFADPRSADPVARESTRLWCVAVTTAQTSLDPQQMKDWTPNNEYGGHAFGIYKRVNGEDLIDFKSFLEQRERILPWIQEYSPYALVTPAAPPVYLSYPTPPAVGQPEKDPVHTANFGVKLQERLREAGVACELVYPGAPGMKHPEVQDYLIDRLQAVR